MARFGVLTASVEMLPYLERCLPPDHRIEACRADDRRRTVDLLIEGPWMPVTIGDAEPPIIDLLFTMHQDDPASAAIRLTGTIHLRADCTWPRPSLGDWEVGRWRSVEAYRDARGALS